MSPRKRVTRQMSADHKAALAEGRTQSRAVRRYLEALEANKPKRGRRRTAESVQKQLDRIEAELKEADPLRALNLRQERINLQRELAGMGQSIDLSGLEKDFVGAAKGYGERRGISYDVWRQAGVPAAVLKRAGISRGAG